MKRELRADMERPSSKRVPPKTPEGFYPDRLLAKPLKPNNTTQQSGVYLPGHILAVYEVAGIIHDLVGPQLLKAAKLPEAWLPRLRLALLQAAAWHDFGKANSEFDRMIRGVTQGGLNRSKQAIRHELLSLLILLCPLRWLYDAASLQDPLAAWAALLAAVGHHAKFTGLGVYQGRVTLYLGHPDFGQVLAVAKGLLDLPPRETPCVGDVTWDLGEEKFQDLTFEVNRFLQRESAKPRTEEENRFIALVRVLLVGADTGGSAVCKSTQSMDWVRQSLSSVVTTEDISHVLESRLKGRTAFEFQGHLAGVEGGVTLVTAGCGRGKTVGAYLWAQKNAIGRKLFFCYPTTGTATQGFLDYLRGKDKATLHHSRLSADIQDLLLGGPETAFEEVELALRLVRMWPSKEIVCTVDTVVGLLQFYKTSLFTSPLIVNGAFIFDEVHSYDDALFGHLLRFLELFPGAPVLLMTASLQPGRLAQLRQKVPHLNLIEDVGSLGGAPRYLLHCAEEMPWDKVREAIAQGRKVLVVANTVNSAMSYYRDAKAFGLPVLTYHSRFRYEDRKSRHEELVRRFSESGPVLACTTQVAEMSLDLSSALLITEQAPTAALIQRLGRCNRFLEHSIGEAYLIPPPEGKAVPYVDEDKKPLPEFEDGLKFWVSLQGRPVSQDDLATEMLKYSTSGVAEISVPLLVGGFASVPGEVRTSEDVNLTSLLAFDIPHLQHLKFPDLDAELTNCQIPLPTYWIHARLPTNYGKPWAKPFKYHPIYTDRWVTYDSEEGASFNDQK